MMIACMFAVRVLAGTPTLPELFQDQVLALVPGFVFSFALDRLQFAAKPLLLVGLAFTALPAGAVLGWLYGRAWPRDGWINRKSLMGGITCGFSVWAVLELAVAAWGDGASAAITSSGLLLASSEAFGVGLVVVAHILDAPGRQARIDRRRRSVVFGGLIGGALVLAGGGLARVLALNSEQSTLAPEAGAARDTAAESNPAPRASASVSSVTSAPLTIPAGVAEEVTPNERFYVVSKNFNDPRVKGDLWSFEVLGLVAQPRQFSYEEVLALPMAGQHTTLECISNTLGGKLISNANWTGVPVARLLSIVGPQSEATAVIFRSADNYYESFPLDVMMAPDVLLAHTMNGAPLPDKHGFPLRLILPGRYGMKNPKWIVKMELAVDRIDGYWVRRGWDREAPVQTVARIDTPSDNASVAGSRLELGGVAFAGSPGISRVEASLDGGTTWREARTTTPRGLGTWVRWALDWDNIPPGCQEVLARATDGTGALQTPEEHDPFPKGATGYHRAKIEVRA